MLYRLCYLREGKMHGCTIYAADLVEALLVQEMWEETAKVKVLTIKRVYMKDFASIGVIDDEGWPFALTLELPWKNNTPEVSCIPKGEYICKRVNTSRHGECFEICDVPGRTAVLIHWGNVTSNSQGCVLLGEEFGELSGQFAVLSSRTAYSEFMKRVSGHANFRLVIEEP